MDYFFAGCTTETEWKQRYRELAKIHHPDAGGNGNTELFKIIASQYAAFKNKSILPRNPKKWGNVKRRNCINKLLKIRQYKDLKKSWVYFAFKNTLLESNQQMTRDDLEFIAIALGYKKGWVDIMCLENEIK